MSPHREAAATTEGKGGPRRSGRGAAGGPGRQGYPGAGRRVPWYVGLPVTLAVIAALFLVAVRQQWLPGLPDLLGTRTLDRSGPAVLRSIQDMSRYEAASGNFQVVVDLEKDARFLPDALRGTRTLYVGAGTVGAYVDLGRVGRDGVTVSPDRRSAVLRLPHARLERAALDPRHSYVVAEQRGLFDRLGDLLSRNPGDEHELNVLAAQKIQDAARASDLDSRAEQNTRAMLTGLLHSLGFTEVTVEFR